MKRYTSKRDRAELFLRQDGKCKCGVKLVKENTIVEHSTPLALGGLDVLENKYLNCRDCAAIKTNGGPSKATTYGSDIHAIAKTRRLRGETKPRRKKKIPGRKLQSASRWPKRSFS